jgi:hypothetical protein
MDYSGLTSYQRHYRPINVNSSDEHSREKAVYLGSLFYLTIPKIVEVVMSLDRPAGFSFTFTELEGECYMHFEFSKEDSPVEISNYLKEFERKAIEAAGGDHKVGRIYQKKIGSSVVFGFSIDSSAIDFLRTYLFFREVDKVPNGKEPKARPVVKFKNGFVTLFDGLTSLMCRLSAITYVYSGAGERTEDSARTIYLGVDGVPQHLKFPSSEIAETVVSVVQNSLMEIDN